MAPRRPRVQRLAGLARPDTHVGSEHVVTEYFTGLPAEDLIIQFRDPSEFFDPTAYEAARAKGAVSCAVLGRTGMSHEPDRASADGSVLGGRLLHVGRDTPWGWPCAAISSWVRTFPGSA